VLSYLKGGSGYMTQKIILSSIFLSIFLLFSFCLVSVSIFIDTNFESREDLRKGKFGFPIPFLYQDLIASGLNGYEGGFPHKFFYYQL
jgi:hypothetical protein